MNISSFTKYCRDINQVKLKNVYIILQQIYLANGVPNFIRITRVLWEILQKKHFGLYFSGHSVYIHVKMLTAQPVAKLILSQIHGHRATVI